MDNEYQSIMEELKSIKKLVLELKKSIDSKDNEIKELKEMIKATKIVEENKEDKELKEVLDSKDPMNCYQYIINHQDIDYTELERIILDSKDLKANYKFISNIHNDLFKEHLKIILDSKDPSFNYYTAVNVRLNSEEVAQIRQIILDSKNIEYIYRFATDLKYIYETDDVSNIDISDLEEAIINSFDFKYYYLFCRKVENANISLFQKHLLELAGVEDINYIFSFGVDIKKANLEECKNKIVELYNSSNSKKEIIEVVDRCERDKIKCLFRSTFGDKVVIE